MLSTWEEFAAKHWQFVDVCADGMCGWFSILLATGRIQDTAETRNPASPFVWKEEGYKILRSALDGVAKLLKDSAVGFGDDQESGTLPSHVLAGFDGEDLQGKAEQATAMAEKLEVVTRPRCSERSTELYADKDAWFSDRYGNSAAVYFKVPIVFVAANDICKNVPGALAAQVYFQLFLPVPTEQYSCDEGMYGGKRFATFNEVVTVLDEVQRSVAIAEPVFLHLSLAGWHFSPYTSRQHVQGAESMSEVNSQDGPSTSGGRQVIEPSTSGGRQVVAAKGRKKGKTKAPGAATKNIGGKMHGRIVGH